MAGEKTIAKKPEPKVEIEKTPELIQEKTITFTPEQLNELIAGAVGAAVKAAPGAVQPAKVAEVQSNIANQVTRRINKRVQEGQKFYSLLASSKLRVRISIPKIYQEHIGQSLTVTINGSTVKVPVDGKNYFMHPAHAAIVNEKLRYVSENIARSNRNVDLFGDDSGDFGKAN